MLPEPLQDPLVASIPLDDARYGCLGALHTERSSPVVPFGVVPIFIDSTPSGVLNMNHTIHRKLSDSLLTSPIDGTQ